MGCASGAYSLDIAMTDSVTATGHRDGSVKLWSIRDAKLMHEIKNVHDSLISSCQYVSSDSNQLVTSSRDQTVKLIDLRMFKVIATYESEHFYTTNDNS